MYACRLMLLIILQRVSIVIALLVSAPSAPMITSIIPASNHLTVEWNEPVSPNGLLQDYKLIWKAVDIDCVEDFQVHVWHLYYSIHDICAGIRKTPPYKRTSQILILSWGRFIALKRITATFTTNCWHSHVSENHHYCKSVVLDRYVSDTELIPPNSLDSSCWVWCVAARNVVELVK